MKYFEMFAGVGGIGRGIPEDWELVGLSEIDKYASQVLRYHYPNIKNYGNCETINWAEVPDFDLLTGGSPCQDFSIAGKRGGLAGAKSSLAWEFIRALREKQPKYFLWENVKGVLSSRGGWDFANLVSAFSESGYSLWWQVLNAKDFGVPQNRERIFVFGVRDGSPKEVFFERESDEPSEIEREIRFGNFGRKATTGEGIANTLTRNYGELSGDGTKILVERHLSNSNQRNVVYEKGGLAPALNTAQGGGLTPLIFPLIFAVRKSGDRGKQKVYTSETMGALSSNPMSDAIPQVSDGTQIRKLMPIECERLMSWKDDWTKWGINEKGEKVEMSDSQRYKMCGNGVVSPVIAAIMEKLL